MFDDVPYCNPPKLYVSSLKVVLYAIKRCFNEEDPDKLAKAELTFPSFVCNDLVAKLTSGNEDHSVVLLHAILGSSWCRYTRLHLRYSRDGLAHWPFEKTFQRPLTELTIECDPPVRKDFSLTTMGSVLGDTLVSLTIKHFTLRYKDLQCGLDYLAKLEYLSIPYCLFSGESSKHLWPVLPSLQVLDCSFPNSPRCEDVFTMQKRVKVLQLHGALVKTSMFSLLTNLNTLDISAKLGGKDSSADDSSLMAALAKMPSLKNLDVSCREGVSVAHIQLFDPPHHRMQFLGLFNAVMCDSQSVNADQVTGDQTESQILLGLELYKERYDYMYELMLTLAQYVSPVEFERGLKAILEACQLHQKSTSLLVAGVASLYWYLKGPDTPVELRRKSIRMVVDIMSKHRDCSDLMYNCCVCLYPYQTKEDSGFILTNLAISLVNIVRCTTSLRTLLMTLLVLSKLIWWLPKPEKIWIAQLETIEITLDVLVSLNHISPHGLRENPLELMEAGWNILWNMTDECPENCMLFCESSGIEVTLTCYKSHQEAVENAMPSMFGALGNVAEVDELQSKIMTRDVIMALKEAVANDKHHRMSYSIGGVIANLAYKGVEFWGDVQPSRQSMLDFMAREMQEWDMEGEVWIEFNSLTPLMKIMQSPEDKVAYWGVRTLAGLSRIRQKRYCNLLHTEGVIEVFREIATRTHYDINLSPSLPQLARIIVQNYESFVTVQQPMDTA